VTLDCVSLAAKEGEGALYPFSSAERARASTMLAVTRIGAVEMFHGALKHEALCGGGVPAHG
jgi:hypothetical protein